jgi:hypothetical protein
MREYEPFGCGFQRWALCVSVVEGSLPDSGIFGTVSEPGPLVEVFAIYIDWLA